jgi:hypothetical protein
MSGQSLQSLYSRKAYKTGDSGEAFEKKIIDVCQDINSGVDVPAYNPRAPRQQWPLAIALMPRSLKYVVANIDPNPARDFHAVNFEIMHKDTIFDMSLPAMRIRTEDISDEFFEIVAQDMQGGQDASILEQAPVLASPQAYAQGTPSRTGRATGEDQVLQLRRLAMGSVTPTRIGVKPATPQTPNQNRMQRQVHQLKQKNWVINPFALSDSDHAYLRNKLMQVLEGMMGETHAGKVHGMTLSGL